MLIKQPWMKWQPIKLRCKSFLHHMISFLMDVILVSKYSIKAKKVLSQTPHNINDDLKIHHVPLNHVSFYHRNPSSALLLGKKTKMYVSACDV